MGREAELNDKPKTAVERMDAAVMEHNRVLKHELLPFAKNLEPQLRDLGAHHAADRIAAILGALDVVEKEIGDAINADPLAILKVLADMRFTR